MMKQLLLLALLMFASSESAQAGWIRRADFGQVGRHRGTGCSVGNKGYFGLGHYNGTGTNVVKKDWWEYDPATNAWTQKADFIGGSSQGTYAVVIFGIGSHAYITGGTFNDPNTYRYSPATNTWDNVAVCPVNVSNVDGFVIDDKGYVVSGNQFYEFNATTLQWTVKSAPPFSASAWSGAFAIGEKGYYRTNSGFYEYKPLTDSWINRAYFPGAATGASMNIVQDGKGYVVCGYGGGLSNVNSEVWEFDPFMNAWTQLEDFPGTSRRFGSSFSIGNRSYVGIGTNGTNFNDFWEFDADLYLNTDALDIAEVKVYPNPVISEVTIRMDAYSTFEVALIDMNGKLLQTQKSTTGTCTLLRNDLPSGTYQLRISVLGNLLGTKTVIFN